MASSMAEQVPSVPSGRVHKRALSDQQKRRDLALERQQQGRRNLQQHARHFVSAFVPQAHQTLPHTQDERIWIDSAIDTRDRTLFNDSVSAEEEAQSPQDVSAFVPQAHQTLAHTQDERMWIDSAIDTQDRTPFDDSVSAEEEAHSLQDGVAGLLEATKLRGLKARQWFKQQFMIPEWMVDIPLRLKKDWYVLARPAGQRCIVVSSNGTTVSRLRNGSILHCFPSALPNGARVHGSATSSHIFCILDCIFHESDSTYYIIDMLCWRGYSLYDCNFEFRYFWMNSKLAETGACDPPSTYHRYCFSIVPVFECNVPGLQATYNGVLPFERDGCLFMNRHAHYVLGITPLALLWKDSLCSRYYIDTDSKGNVPADQQVVLELQEDGTVATSDEPRVLLGSMPQQFLHQNKKHLKTGMLLRFAIGEQGLSIVNGRPVAADIHYQGLANRSRAGADSMSKVLFQYAARHAPLTISDLLAAIESSDDEGDKAMDA